MTATETETAPALPESEAGPWLAGLEARAAELAASGPRVMLDSARPGLIPASAPMVAGYVDGDYQWLPSDWDRFDGRPRVRITVEPFNRLHQPTGFSSGDFQQASTIDVEKGAFSPNDAARFVPARQAFRPDTATVYVDWLGLDQVLSAARGQSYWLWLAWFIYRTPTAADLATVLNRLSGSGVALAAWQHTPGTRFDTSAVYAARWHPDAAG